ncbi:unnamed protein product [Pleuronectes platessa]|uniref:Uncharacterized protein n=1 Tax=Pleuronectes platessa TaxID=8262 RepID=A0A9N7U1Y7_PLEPL|nr:unnamed protein product [Pleuronectes platessa]
MSSSRQHQQLAAAAPPDCVQLRNQERGLHPEKSSLVYIAAPPGEIYWNPFSSQFRNAWDVYRVKSTGDFPPSSGTLSDRCTR